ncbi:MAG: hypothetical protein K5639_07160 [Eubacterium sp.]|nr:hypothetical protein [Eubacterium sp.]
MDELEKQAKLTREKYCDILEFDRPASNRPKMTLENRAAQFAPFAALTGFHESVGDTENEYARLHETGGVSSEAAEEY